jgi:hypothetical protein
MYGARVNGRARQLVGTKHAQDIAMRRCREFLRQDVAKTNRDRRTPCPFGGRLSQEAKMTPIDEIYPHPDSTQPETNVNTNQDMTNGEEPLALQKQFDDALSDLRSAIDVVTAMNQAVDLDEATRASAMSVVIDALNKAFDALYLAVSRFRKEARQNIQEDH